MDIYYFFKLLIITQNVNLVGTITEIMKKLFIFSILFLALACTRVSVDPPTGECEGSITYTDNIKEILDKSCAYSGCHIDGTAPGDYSNYAGLEAGIASGELRKRMIEIQNMPPEYAPDDKPKSLTEDEMELINCWVQNEYAE